MIDMKYIRKILVFIFGLIFCSQLLSSESVDSLKDGLVAYPDSLNTYILKQLNSSSKEVFEVEVEKYFSLYKDSKSTRRKAIAHYYKAFYIYKNREYENALSAFQKTYDIAANADFKKLEYYSLSFMSYSYYYLGQRKKYLDLLKKMLSLAEEMNNSTYTAMLNHNLMIGYQDEGDFRLAIKFGHKAEKLHRRMNNQREIAETLIALSEQYKTIGDTNKALDLAFEALEIAEKENNILTQSEAITSLANNYMNMNEFQKALDYYFINVTLKEKLKNKTGLAKQFRNIALAYAQLMEWEKSLDYLLRALKLFEDDESHIGVLKTKLSINETLMALERFDEAEKYLLETKVMITSNTMPKILYQYYMDFGDLYFQKQKWDKAVDFYLQADELATQMEFLQFIRNARQALGETYIELNNYKKAVKLFKECSVLSDSIFKHNVNKNLSRYAVKFEVLQKEKELKILRRDNKIQNLELSRDKLHIRFLSLLIAFVIVTLLLGVNRYIVKHRALKSEKQSLKIIQQEKEKSEKLLLNTLPKAIVKELKEKGYSKPQSFPEVTILCTDFVDFTQLSSSTPPNILIEELNELYTEFDEIIEKYNCERIKTSGDAYLAVCGMPLRDEDHATNITFAALEIVDFLNARNKTAPISWGIRIGVHTGSVVGGIVGVKKYLYDVFGDSINIVFRMQSLSEPMKINISQMTSHYLSKSDNTKSISILERQDHEVKGKGLMKMFFVERKN